MQRRCERSSCDLAEQLDRSLTEQNKYQSLLRELLEAQRNRKSEQLSKEQLALFETAGRHGVRKANPLPKRTTMTSMAMRGAGAKTGEAPKQKRGGRQPLARHLKRERIVHDLAEAEKHCDCCGKDLRLIAEETSERYEYIPASMKVIQHVCLKYACACTVKTATKPPQPIEKSTAGASLLAQVIVAKWADHQPLHRQEKMFERHGIDISRKTMGGWMAQCAELLDPLYQSMKKELLSSKVIGTDDTSVKVLDRKLSFARIGRIWPYVGDSPSGHRLRLHTDTRTRRPGKVSGRIQRVSAGGRILRLRCIFQAPTRDDRGRVLDARAKVCVQGVGIRRGTHGTGATPDRAAVCRGRARQGAFAVGGATVGIAPASIGAADRQDSTGICWRCSRRFCRRVRPALNQWEALTRFLEDGELEIDNGATERANRDIALGRGNWTFFGSDSGGKTAAVLRSFIASCKRCGVEPFAWFRDVLSRIPAHSITRLSELLPHNWQPATSPAEG